MSTSSDPARGDTYVRVSSLPVHSTRQLPDEVSLDLDHLGDPVGYEFLTPVAVEVDGVTVHPSTRPHLRPEQCCAEACNGGGCESCRCCHAGWCVTGVDGVPEHEDDLRRWMEVAAEHNPIVAAWRAERAALAGAADTEAVEAPRG